MQVKSRQLWGDLTYTHDSNIVAVLLHLGYYRMIPDRPPSVVVELRALIKLLPTQQHYPSHGRQGLRSRSWRMDPAKDRNYCSYKVFDNELESTVMEELSAALTLQAIMSRRC